MLLNTVAAIGACHLRFIQGAKISELGSIAMKAKYLHYCRTLNVSWDKKFYKRRNNKQILIKNLYLLTKKSSCNNKDTLSI